MAWPPVVILPSCVAAVAAVVLTYSIRGRQVDEHPYCRKCGFDLHGRPADSTRCPECGADLLRPRATRAGRRRRRRGLAWAAGLVLLASAGWVGVAAWAAHRGVDWQRHKPVWVLMYESGSPAPAARDAAIAELHRRLWVGDLSDAQMADLADRALAYQADTTKPWLVEWGAVLEDARDKGRLSDDRWRRYARQAPTARVSIRPVVRQGEPLPVLIEPDVPRIGPRAQFAAEYRFGERYEVGGRPVVYPYPNRLCRVYLNASPPWIKAGDYESGDAARGDALEWMDEAERARLVPGPQTASFPVTVLVFPDMRECQRPGRVPLAEARFDLRPTWTLVPAAGPPTVTLVDDPALWPAVEAAVRVGPPASGYGNAWGAIRGPPMDLACDVYLRSAGREEPFGRFTCRAGQFSNLYLDSYDKHPLFLRTDRVDVILRPSYAAAAATRDIVRIWGGELVFEGPPVPKSPADMSPAAGPAEGGKP